MKIKIKKSMTLLVVKKIKKKNNKKVKIIKNKLQLRNFQI